jgi:hypothetical protein
LPPSDTEASSSTTTLPGFTGTSTSSPTASSSSSSDGLSTAAAAGIGAGVGALALIAILLGVFLLMRRRKQRNNSNPVPENGKLNHEYEYVEQGPTPVAEMWQPPAELASGQYVREKKKQQQDLAELPPNYPAQAQKTNSPVELDSTQLR